MATCIFGQWLACPEPVPYADVGVGLEFTADGQVIRLVLDEDCNVQRGAGNDHVGVWKYGDVGTGDGPNGLLVSWNPQRDGWWAARPVFTSTPEQMRSESFGILVRP